MGSYDFPASDSLISGLSGKGCGARALEFKSPEAQDLLVLRVSWFKRRSSLREDLQAVSVVFLLAKSNLS